ncbi:MAG: hypothetical protein KDA24_03910 [Deltaproteobacteria bacterium]|nr:hypothetical protein [Deltaproteobacteria bacterium]
MKSRVLSTLIFVGAVLLLARGLAPDRTEEDSAGLLRVQQLEPEASVDYAIPAGTARVLISTRLLAPQVAPARWAPLYGVELTWMDADGEVVREQTVEFQGRQSRMPTASEEFEQSHLVGGAHAPVSDPRSALVPFGELLPSGGFLRIRNPHDERTVLYRISGEAPRSSFSTGQLVVSASERAARSLAMRVGAQRWSALDPTERRLIASQRRMDLVPRAGTQPTRRVVALADDLLTWREQPAGELDLEDGRSMAVNLIGPVQLRVSGGPGIRALDATVISAAAGDGQNSRIAAGPQGGSQTLRGTPAQPLGFYGESDAVVFTVEHEGPFALHLHNHSGGDVRPLFLSVDQASSDRWYGWTTGLRLGDRHPGGAGGPATTLVAPEYRYISAVRIGGRWPRPLRVPVHADGEGLVVLEVRPLLDAPTDTRPRTLTVRWRGDDGTNLAEESATVPVVYAPYERHFGSAVSPGGRRGHLSESTRLFVPVGMGTRHLEVTSPDDLLVIPRLEGPPTGDEVRYESAPGLRLRFARTHPTVWHRVPALNQAGLRAENQISRFAANTRLELPPEPSGNGGPAGGDAPRYLRLLPEPSPSIGTPLTWLVPPTADTPGTLYCRFEPDANKAPFRFDASAREALDGRLVGIVMAPTRQLGAPFRVDLDTERWTSGITNQRVRRFTAVREPTHRQARFEGPPGSVLWLRTAGRPSASCDRPHRPLSASQLSPGGRVDFLVDKTSAKQRLIVGGLGPGEAPLRLTLDGGTPSRVPGLHTEATRADRRVVLASTGRPGRRIDDPDRILPTLRPSVLVLGPDLELGTHVLTIENLGVAPIDVRVSLEGGTETERTTNPRVVRTPEIAR